MKSFSAARKDPDCICRTCIVFPCCKARYYELKNVLSAGKKIVGECSYFSSHYKPMLKSIKDALEHEGKNSSGLFLLIEDPFIEREYPAKKYISFS